MRHEEKAKQRQKAVEYLQNELRQAILQDPHMIEKQKIEIQKQLQEIESQRDTSTVWAYFDFDMFYVAASLLSKPELKDKPVAVGDLSMLATSNYVARKYGVRSAMPGFLAKKLCPELIIIEPDFVLYKAKSKILYDICREYDPQATGMGLDEINVCLGRVADLELMWNLDIETWIQNHLSRESTVEENQNSKIQPKTMISLDRDSSDCESILELYRQSKTDNRLGDQSTSNATIVQDITLNWTKADKVAFKVSEEIRQKIYQWTDLTVSGGIAGTARLAKMCSEVKKPNGLFLLPNNRKAIIEFLAPLPVRKIMGIGTVTEFELKELGVKNIGDIVDKAAELSIVESASQIEYLLHAALGVSEVHHSAVQEQKSFSQSRTHGLGYTSLEIEQMLTELSKSLFAEMSDAGFVAKTVAAFLRTCKWEDKQHQRTVTEYVTTQEQFYAIAHELFNKIHQGEKIRLIGLRLSNLMPRAELDEQTLKLPSKSNQPKIDDWVQTKVLPETAVTEQKSVNNQLPLGKRSYDSAVSIENTTLESHQTPKRINFETEQREVQGQTGMSHDEISKAGQIVECPLCLLKFQVYSNKSWRERHIADCLDRTTIEQSKGQALFGIKVTESDVSGQKQSSNRKTVKMRKNKDVPIEKTIDGWIQNDNSQGHRENENIED